MDAYEQSRINSVALHNILVHSPVRFLRVAQAWLDAAIEHNNGEQSGLGECCEVWQLYHLDFHDGVNSSLL